MREPGLPPFRYLSASHVEASLPPVERRLQLADRAMRALDGEAELPPKIGIHPRPTASFAHAMPAFLLGDEPSGTADLLGMKWVVGFPTNTTLGLRAISALVVINDPGTGFPLAVLDGAPITAHRTAAVSGLAIRALAPSTPGRAARVAFIGAGVQGRAHLAVIAEILPGAELVIHDRHHDRADGLAGLARQTMRFSETRTATSGPQAIDGADVVVTMIPFGPVRQIMPPDWLGPTTLVVAVDYATYVSAAVAREAALFVVDDRGTFEANRSAGLFEDYPDPAVTLGEVLAGSMPRPRGRVLVTHLGVGLTDLVFAREVLATAERGGLGVVLTRE